MMYERTVRKDVLGVLQVEAFNAIFAKLLTLSKIGLLTRK